MAKAQYPISFNFGSFGQGPVGIYRTSSCKVCKLLLKARKEKGAPYFDVYKSSFLEILFRFTWHFRKTHDFYRLPVIMLIFPEGAIIWVATVVAEEAICVLYYLDEATGFEVSACVSYGETVREGSVLVHLGKIMSPVPDRMAE